MIKSKNYIKQFMEDNDLVPYQKFTYYINGRPSLLKLYFTHQYRLEYHIDGTLACKVDDLDMLRKFLTGELKVEWKERW